MPRLVDEKEVERLRKTDKAKELAEMLRRSSETFKDPAYKRSRELYTAALLEANLEQDEEFFVGLFFHFELKKMFNQALSTLHP